MSGSDWAALGAIAEAVASVGTLVAILVTIYLYARERREDTAAGIRTDIRALADAIGRLARAMRPQDASVVISPPWAARTLILKSLDDEDDATEEDVRSVITRQGLPIGVASWDNFANASGLRQVLDDVFAGSRRVPGALKVVATTSELLLAIVDDVRTTYLRLLVDPGIVAKFFESNEKHRAADVVDEFTQHLYGSLAQYFSLRYEHAVPLIDDLAQRLAFLLTALDASQLVAASHDDLREETPSRTEEIHARLRLLTKYLGSDRVSEIDRLVDPIAESISKDKASSRIDE